ncbi:hypothetical protein WOLCODRAFT_28753 [Wolfiporia cocos MD-104 SS10]|uniref:Uncharacterized protein n=1 Tax=Wolfiporia cocos (strain MD-104) TaxID=742152 RepID=A0A2H3J3G6_WOLCO|nr:hypothetical protein WOLCODRAFT_28753 [Wolfiporia cocos MD-104 SS10]
MFSGSDGNSADWWEARWTAEPCGKEGVKRLADVFGLDGASAQYRMETCLDP